MSEVQRRNFDWTLGDDKNTEHMRLIDRGAFGEVHEASLYVCLQTKVAP